MQFGSGKREKRRFVFFLFCFSVIGKKKRDVRGASGVVGKVYYSIFSEGLSRPEKAGGKSPANII